jgi:hypothetical protein
MAAPEPLVCPHCGSSDTEVFADGSGACRSCGKAIRGPKPVSAVRVGEEVETRRAAKVREKERLGLLGIVGGFAGYLGIPGLFLLGAAVNGRGALDYVAVVVNQPRGAIVCGGLVVLAVTATYALWAGSLVWRGFREKAFHLLLAGVLTTVAAVVAGPGLEGAVGIVGGVLALLGGLIVWRREKQKEEGNSEAAASSPPEAA